MIKFEFSDKKITATVVDSFERLASVDCSVFNILGKDRKVFLNAMLLYTEGHQPDSQKTWIAKIKYGVGNAVVSLGVTALPKTTSGWRQFVLDLSYFSLMNSGKASLKNRCNDWNKYVAKLLLVLRDNEGLIPNDVEIPLHPTTLDSIQIEPPPDALLGQVSTIKNQHHDSKTNLLIDISWSRTDADYLDLIRIELNQKREILHEKLLSWWEQIRDHFLFGKYLLNSFGENSPFEFIQAIVDEEEGYKPRVTSEVMTSERYWAEMLTVIQQFYECRISKEMFENDRTFPSYSTIKVPSTAPKAVSSNVGWCRRINWMVGNLTGLDISLINALLVMHNPMFTPYSLRDSKFRDKEGKLYIEIGDGGTKLRIAKQRAKAFKDSLLDELSMDIVFTVVEMTAYSRELLRDIESPAADLLFIQYSKGEHKAPTEIGSHLTGPVGRLSLYQFYPELESALPRGSISMRKIRATEGTLEWFKTGSIRSMAMKIGNTSKTTLIHYLPQALIAAWNTRLIRRFQNLWLALASAGEDFLLEAVDFNNLQDLNAFISSMLELHAINSSPLATELHKLFSSSLDKSPQDITPIYMSISAASLTVLYLYENCALAAGLDESALARQDVVTGLCPKQFIDLATVVRHTLGADDESRPQLDEDLIIAHETAIARVNALEGIIHWTSLFTRSEIRHAA